MHNTKSSKVWQKEGDGKEDEKKGTPLQWLQAASSKARQYPNANKKVNRSNW